MKTFAHLASAALLIAACGDSDSNSNRNAADDLLACDNRSIESTCAEYARGTAPANARTSCDGVLIEGGCKLEGTVGRCRVETGGGALVNVYYSDGPSPKTEADARAHCERAGGAFTTPVE